MYDEDVRQDVRAKQQQEKAKFYDQCAGQPMTQACDPSLGALGGYKQTESGYRNSIRRRVERTIAEFETSIKRAGAAQRVKEIIDQHPEFAELLDLLTEL